MKRKLDVVAILASLRREIGNHRLAQSLSAIAPESLNIEGAKVSLSALLGLTASESTAPSRGI